MGVWAGSGYIGYFDFTCPSLYTVYSLDLQGQYQQTCVFTHVSFSTHVCSLKAVDTGLPPGQTGLQSYLSLQVANSLHANENLKNTRFTNLYLVGYKYSRLLHVYMFKLQLCYVSSPVFFQSVSSCPLCILFDFKHSKDTSDY